MRLGKYFPLFVMMHLIILSLASTVAANEEMSKIAPEDPLPSWNGGPTKAAIISFVANTTNESHPEYVAPDDRIATFDNDGTLWCEFPDYVPFLFMLDRIKVMAPEYPEWNDTEPFSSILTGKRYSSANSASMKQC